MELLTNLYDFFTYWFLALICTMIFNLALINGITWGLLAFCRLVRIPWIDGTTEGFHDRN